MKKYVVTGLLCFAVCTSFGQKKAVTSAKNEIKGSNPNITEARSLIKEALVDVETANDAETWYVAGLIESKQFDKECENQILGKAVNEEVMYSALEGILPYFLKAVELDQLPDAKGKVKPRFTKDIKSIIRANRQYYVNAGIIAYEKGNSQKAYENFKLFGDIPKLSLFEGDKWVIDNDSSEFQIRLFSGIAASEIPDSKAAISIFEEIKNAGYNENEIYQRLATEYNKVEDTVAYAKVIEDGLKKFPEERFFLLNQISLNITSQKYDDAVSNLKKALVQFPDDAILNNWLGQLYDQELNNRTEAISYLKKAIDIEPENTEFMTHLGRVYFNLGVEKRKEADDISNASLATDLRNQSLDNYKESMKIFEKIYELEPTNKNAILALSMIYYNLNMPKYEEMEKLYESLE